MRLVPYVVVAVGAALIGLAWVQGDGPLGVCGLVGVLAGAHAARKE